VPVVPKKKKTRKLLKTFYVLLAQKRKKIFFETLKYCILEIVIAQIELSHGPLASLSFHPFVGLAYQMQEYCV
jgi:hypothetical protein